MEHKAHGILRIAAICTLLPTAVVRAEDALDRAEARARELCARMTLEEKAGELKIGRAHV